MATRDGPIFKRLPLLLAFTCEMREPGDYKSVEVVGVPVLIVRGQDGRARAYIGVCSHRGTVLTEEGKGRCEHFTCPYHGWTYNDRGALIGVAGRRKFGDIDTASRGLTELPSVERAGLIFVSLTPGGIDRSRRLPRWHASRTRVVRIRELAYVQAERTAHFKLEGGARRISRGIPFRDSASENDRATGHVEHHDL